jgi:hypothetical protein
MYNDGGEGNIKEFVDMIQKYSYQEASSKPCWHLNWKVRKTNSRSCGEEGTDHIASK